MARLHLSDQIHAQRFLGLGNELLRQAPYQIAECGKRVAIEWKQSEVLKALQPLHALVAAAAGFSFFINILMMVPALYMLQIYDRALESQSESTLLMLTLIMMFLLVALGGLDWVRGQLMNRAGARLDQLLAERVFDATFRLSLSSAGRSSAQTLSDLSGLRSFVSGPTLNAFFDMPWVPIYILVLFAFHPWFGVLAVCSVALLGGLTWLNQRLTGSRLGEANQEMLWTRNYANRHVRNAEVIEAMGMMANVRTRWLQHNHRVVGLQAFAADQSGVLTSASKALRILLQSLSLGLGAYLAINMEISLGMVIAGSILLGRALAPVDHLVGAWKHLIQARQQFERLEALLRKVPPRKTTLTLPEPRGQLTVEGIQVVPPGARLPALKGVSFTLKAGEFLGVIGPSAAGKSTLARAVLGIWPSMVGTVRLDGADVVQWDRVELGASIGYLPQDIELFDGTIADNISRFGESDATQIVAAARLAGVHEMILRLPEGYDTVIGVAGGALAAGQRQRLGLARALYGTPRLVVLDEPNANLDDMGEAALRSALQHLKAVGTTVVVITHRPKIVAGADKLLVLRDGRVVNFADPEPILRTFKQASVPSLFGGSAGKAP